MQTIVNKSGQADQVHTCPLCDLDTGKEEPRSWWLFVGDFGVSTLGTGGNQSGRSF